MLSWELAAGFERAPMALSDSIGHVVTLGQSARARGSRWSGADRVLVGGAVG